MSKKNKFILVVLIITFVLFLLLSFLYLPKFIKRNSCNVKFYNNALENLKSSTSSPFYIEKILYFNSASLESSNPESKNLKSIYQYCDIAVFLSSFQEGSTPENTLKSAYIDNLKFDTFPSLGNPLFLEKNIDDFSNKTYDQNKTINNKLNYTISDKDLEKSDKSFLYNNLSSPIVFSYVNKNIKSINISDYPNEKLYYNGSLMKTFNIPLSSLSCSFSFDIILENAVGNSYIAHINSSIPFKNPSSNESLYDGSLTYYDNVNITFSSYNQQKS